jgi:hypothetical protein
MKPVEVEHFSTEDEVKIKIIDVSCGTFHTLALAGNCHYFIYISSSIFIDNGDLYSFGEGQFLNKEEVGHSAGIQRPSDPYSFQSSQTFKPSKWQPVQQLIGQKIVSMAAGNNCNIAINGKQSLILD